MAIHNNKPDAMQKSDLARAISWTRAHPYYTLSIALSAGIVLLLASFAVFPSSAPEWTGFGSHPHPTSPQRDIPYRSLWDWMELLIVPLIIGVAAYWFSQIQQNRDIREVQTDRELAEDARDHDWQMARDHEEQQVLENYYDRMAELLLEHDLRAESEANEAVRSIARARTLTVLDNLNSVRKGLVLRFLHESNLISGRRPVIDLNRADLSEADLTALSLSGAHLAGTNLSRSKLKGADLSQANLTQANLSGADLMKANLNETVAQETVLSQAMLRDATFISSDLTQAYFVNARLSNAVFNRAKLFGANFSQANLRGTRFDKARFQSRSSANAKEETQEMKIDGAEFSAETAWPDGFDPQACGAVLVEEKVADGEPASRGGLGQVA